MVTPVKDRTLDALFSLVLTKSMYVSVKLIRIVIYFSNKRQAGNTQTGLQTGRQTRRQTGWQIGRQTDRKTIRQTCRQTDRQIDVKADR